ncbi:MAG: ribosomal L7Ae/L30e/S12e/Gadd45 family protein [Oscillospiraceae bacterium]|nr:ribosomal L7Ae/L30e/S12e/Gadd45 family protein [Oscillospiraceae bacterium]
MKEAKSLELKKLRNILSVAKKAGKVCLGFDVAKVALMTGKGFLLLLSDDLSEGTKNSMINIACRSHVKYRVIEASLEEFGNIVGKRVGVVAVIDWGFASKIDEIWEGETGGVLC